MSQRPFPSDIENQSSRATEGDGRHEVPESDSRDPYFDELVNAARTELLYKDSEHTILNLATLQRMVLFRLQAQIIERAGPLAHRRYGYKNPLDDLRRLLADYGNS